MTLGQDIAIAGAVLSGICTTASAITAITGTPAEGTLWAKVYKLVEVLALVVGKAKDQAPTKPSNPS